MKKIISLFLALAMILSLAVCFVGCDGGKKGDEGDQSEKGDTVTQGETGAQGEPGKDGTSLLTGNGAPSDTMGKIGDSYIDLDSWDFYTKTNEGWSLVGNIKGEEDKDAPNDAPEDNEKFSGTYGLNHFVAEWIQTGEKETYNLGDNGLTFDTISLTANDGKGVMSYNFDQLVTRNVTYELTDDKLVIVCEEAVDLFDNGELRDRLELSVEKIDGKTYFVLNASDGSYNYSFYIVKDGDQSVVPGDNDDASTNADEIVLLVDMSESLSGIKSEIDLFVKSVIDSNNRAKIGIVTFGYDQVYAAELSANTTDTYAKYLSAQMPDITATNIADAITYASTLFTSGARSKIVLISDGAETDGNSAHVIKSVAAKGIAVDTVCIAKEAPKNEVQILSLEVPDKIVAGSDFFVKAKIQSSHAGTATIRLFDNGTECEALEIEFFEGIQTISIPCTLQLPGLHEISVQLACSEDTLAINNCYTTCVYLQVCDKILIIENIEGESEALHTMLSEELNVSVINVNDAENMPYTVDELREYDQVILINVANADMPEGFDRLLYSYVYDFGGGLFTVCGNKDDGNPNDEMFEANAYTREDMYGTVYQQMLPVEIIEYTPPVAVVIVIDCSGSMYSPNGSIPLEESKLYAAMQGAEACLDALTDRDWVGITTFSNTATESLEMTPRTDRAKILDAIRSIPQNGGETKFRPALASARASLLALSQVEKKHIIIVTDGAPTDEEERYGAEMKRNAEAGITMSIVGIDCLYSDATRMRAALVNYAGLPAERFHDVRDVSALPAEMRKALEIPEIKEVNYVTFTPRADTSSSILNGIDVSEMPTLDGYYGSKLKDGAEAVLTAPFVPVYAQWKVGKGTVGSFMCDLNGTWSSDFIYSETGVQIIKNIVNNLFPTNDIRPKDIDVVFEGDGYSQQAIVFTDLEEGEYLELFVTNLDGVQVFTANATSGTRFSFSITSAGPHAITVQKKDASGNVIAESVNYKAFSYSKEYDVFYDRESAAENLENIAKHGKGNVIQSPADVFIFITPEPDDEEEDIPYDPAYYNISILDVRTFYSENRHVIEVDIICYGRDMDVDLYFTIDEEFRTLEIVETVRLFADEVTTITLGCNADDFDNYDEYLEALEQFAKEYPELYNLTSYNSITAQVYEDDGDKSDNIFTRERRDIRILYSSTAPDIFVENFLLAFREIMGNNYADVEFTVFDSSRDAEIPTEGYDVYIYEYRMPDTLPIDGVSIIFSPDSAPANSGFTVGNSMVIQNGMSLKKGENHQIMNGVDPKGISITKFVNVTAADALTPILYCGDYPVAFASERSDTSPNVVVFSFSLSYSNFALLVDFPLMMYNIIEHYTAPDSDAEDEASTLSLADTYSDASSNETSNTYVPGIVIDGETYYKELVEMYLAFAKDALEEREAFTKIQRMIIEIYFAIL